MAEVDQVFMDRWRSGKHIGAATPTQWARVRRIHMTHGYRPFTFLDGSTEDFATIPTSSDAKPWWPKLVPKSEWRWLPNLTEVSKSQSFENNGFQTLTVELESVVMRALAGIAGTYMAMARGYLSPWLGFASFGRPTYLSWMKAVNEWHDLLDSAQIEIWQGYGTLVGDAPGLHHTKVFTGLVSDLDMTSNPDHMTITATCFGDNLLGQQRLFAFNKDKKLKPPITFADRSSAYNVKKLGGVAKASSEDRTHPARGVVGTNSHNWLSEGRGSANVTEWIEIHLPKGTYEAFAIFPEWSGMEMFIGMYVRDRQTYAASRHKPPKKAKIDGEEVKHGWYNPDGNMVPGEHGGWPYFKHVKRSGHSLTRYNLGHKFEVGDNTVLRVGFRNLHYHDFKGHGATGNYYAAVQRMYAIQRTLKPEAKKNNWVLVDDAADVVKVVLRWAGFREWEVEDFGVKLDKPLVFHQSNFLIDPIQSLASMANYVFFMGDPTSDDLSMGVPVFRQTRATAPPAQSMIEVRDTDLLTGIAVKLSKSLKASHIWAVGGRPSKKNKAQAVKTALGEDKSAEGMVRANYYPPWGKGLNNKLSGVLKHMVHTDRKLTTHLDCAVMCRLIALQMALQSNTGQIEIPGNPALELDDQISILDEGTGTNTRLWIASRQDTFTSGQATSWKTTLAGSWIDTADVLLVAFDLIAAVTQKKRYSEPSGPANVIDHNAPGFSGGGARYG